MGELIIISAHYSLFLLLTRNAAFFFSRSSSLTTSLSAISIVEEGERFWGVGSVMDGGGVNYNPRTVEQVFRDFKGRRAGMIKALTTGLSLSLSLSLTRFCSYQLISVFPLQNYLFLFLIHSNTQLSFSFLLRCWRIFPAVRSWLGFILFAFAISFTLFSVFPCVVVCN